MNHFVLIFSSDEAKMTLFIKLTVLISLTLQVYCISRFKSNLILYSGYNNDDKHVIYTSSEIGDWKNLPKLAQDAGLQQKALLCGIGNGAWIAYPDVDYKTTGSHNYAKLLLGDTCIAADHINSVQPVGSITKEKDGLLTFTAPNFGSESKLVSGEGEIKSADGVGSLITTMGHFGQWTVEGDGKKYCLSRPWGIFAVGVCVLPDLETEFGIKSAKVTVGCEGNGTLSLNSSVIHTQLQTCFARFGAYRILTNYLKLPVISSICSNSADPDTKLGFQKIMDVWKFRMNPTHQMEPNPADIDRGRDDSTTPLRMDILNHFFEIFKEGCTSNGHVPEWYFNLIRYLYMQHIKSAWEKAPHIIYDRNDTRLSWTVAYDYLKECYFYSVTTQMPSDATVPCKQPEPSNKFEEDVLELMLEGDDLDHVIEQFWIMLNYVGPFCSDRYPARDNMYADFIIFFRKNFLLPVIQQWMNPGTWQTYYEYMFNGASIEKGKRLLIQCTRESLRDRTWEPIDRPSASMKDFVSIRKSKQSAVEPRAKTSGKEGRRKREAEHVNDSPIRDKRKKHSVHKEMPNAQQLQYNEGHGDVSLGGGHHGPRAARVKRESDINNINKH